MLKMIIADDERAIRESISSSIDWKSLGIQIAGLAKNAREAYELILDECPDIVLTDIRMPGFSGLELIARTAQTHPQTEFIILSGYGEFEYAKEAMQRGVKHYLLKPCAPEQLIDVIQRVKDDCYKKRLFQDMQDKQRRLQSALRQGVIRSALIEALSSKQPLDAIVEKETPYLDFDSSSYELYQFSPFSQDHVREVMEALNDYQKSNAPGIPLYALCVQSTLFIFFETYDNDYRNFEQTAKRTMLKHVDSPMINHQSFSSLRLMLQHLIGCLANYESVLLIDDAHGIAVNNYSAYIQQIQQLFCAIKDDPDNAELQLKIKDSIEHVSNESFRELLITNAMMRGISLPESVYDSLGAAVLPEMIAQRSLADELKKCVRQHLSDPSLSLKWLAENELFMNADYLSKQFTRQTGEKFSAYLTRKRIERAKELLRSENAEHIYSVAEQVGMGNNPQYFSQMFKRITGMTPSEYAAT